MAKDTARLWPKEPLGTLGFSGGAGEGAAIKRPILVVHVVVLDPGAGEGTVTTGDQLGGVE